MPSTPRSLKDAMNNAERLRKELPILIQPSSCDYDMVTLADRILGLEAGLREAREIGDDCTCPVCEIVRRLLDGRVE